MDILHVNNPSWVASKLVKWQRLAGHRSDLLSTYAVPGMGMPDFYEPAFPPVSPREFAMLAISMAGRYDVVHLHSMPGLAARLRARHPRKRIILHWHGSDIRGRGGAPALGERAASRVLVSTPDLPRYSKGAVYLPNPVDTDHFSPRRPGSGRGVTLLARGAPERSLRERLARVDLDWDAVDTASSPVRYADLPGLLSRYGTYIDVKWMVEHGEYASFRSQACLEALSLGLRALDHDMEFRTGLPSEHRPESVVRRLQSLYE